MKEGEVLIFEEKDSPAIKLYSNRGKRLQLLGV
jgi:hypothetical protein